MEHHWIVKTTALLMKRWTKIARKVVIVCYWRFKEKKQKKVFLAKWEIGPQNQAWSQIELKEYEFVMYFLYQAMYDFYIGLLLSSFFHSFSGDTDEIEKWIL